MKSEFFREIGGIYRLRVPFDNIYTSVFFVTTEEARVLVDAASSGDDVDEYVIPALAALGYGADDVTHLVLTHSHGDHMGGARRILELMPKVRTVTEVCEITKGLATYPLAGHTDDSIGLFVEKHAALITGDGIQGAGVDKYRTLIKNRNDYLKTLERIEGDGRVENLLFSHAYEPWESDSAIGRKTVLRCLLDCRKY